MHNIMYDSPEQVKPKGASPLRVKPAVAVDLMIPPAHEIAVVAADFILHALKPPVASPAIITARAGTTTLVLHEFHGQRHDAHSHWGLNE